MNNNIRTNKTKEELLMDIEIAKAKRYKEYVLGWAYIPLTDLPKYEKAYSKIYK